MVLTRDKILSAQDLPIEDVECPEWGGTLRVRGLTAEERSNYHNKMFITSMRGSKVEVVPNKHLNGDAYLVALCVVNEDMERLFTDADVVALSKKSSKVIKRLSKAIQDISGMTKEAEELLGKDSADSQEESSPSS